MTSQVGHSCLTLATNCGLSCASYRAVLFSGSKSAIFAPLPAVAAWPVVAVELDESSLPPHPAATAASDAASAKPAATRGMNLGYISPPRAILPARTIPVLLAACAGDRSTTGLYQQAEVDYTTGSGGSAASVAAVGGASCAAGASPVAAAPGPASW